MSSRPADLPDYDNPPLDEVVVGVQFDKVANYSSVAAGAVWELFRDEFPSVQEVTRLSPQFETFGREGSRASATFDLGGVAHGRLWFVSADDSHLLQFQEDRFLLNWRRRDTASEYPRFEGISSLFEKYFLRLRDFMAASLGARLAINQAEVTYFNILPVKEFAEAGKWLNFVNLCGLDVEGINLNAPVVVRNEKKEPVARLYHEVNSLVSHDDKQRLLRYTLTFRGKPATADVADALSLISIGRDMIVRRFSDTTTDFAHQQWERIV